MARPQDATLAAAVDRLDRARARRGARRPNTVRVWSGPSPVDGAPIEALLSGLQTPSSNRKTGAMLQLVILRADLDASAAKSTGADRSICGDCPLRGNGCYVNVGQAPLAQSRASLRGNIPTVSLDRARELTRGRPVRLGSYGDPGMLPLEVLRALTEGASLWTGYTHQWRTLPMEYAGLLMASVDTVLDRVQATAAGWRWFGLAEEIDGVPDAIECPADSRGVQCRDCGLCAGNARAGARNILIRPHGAQTRKALEVARG